MKINKMAELKDSDGKPCIYMWYQLQKKNFLKLKILDKKPLKDNLIYYQKYKRSQNAYPNTKILKESAKLNF